MLTHLYRLYLLSILWVQWLQLVQRVLVDQLGSHISALGQGVGTGGMEVGMIS